jgi:hypothetical protein
MSLIVVDTEVRIGDFRLDIHAKDGNDRSVVIENQLERTDHGHLGQCLVYASGLDASTVIWVAPNFREEFRSALDWLNERTDSELGFFGVEVGIVQIGHGPPAPVFDIVSRPNDWQKTVKTAGSAAEARVSTPVNAARQALFTDILTDANTRQPAISVPTPGKGNWISFASGPFGNWDLTVSDGRLARRCLHRHLQPRCQQRPVRRIRCRRRLLADQARTGAVMGAARRQTCITHRYL